MKKALDQTLRDLKREVNKKVLKVPGIEQKVLDATSNEPWGPHGSHLADIAQATRNYHEYQMIMSVVWKRINDTGKNWRHVYKALTVLEYLVANGSERVIDEIREHAYQISTLSDFQYIDSNGRDQGSNVRKKSQSLVVLVNDKERIQEVRQKALTNKEKFRNASTSGMYRPGAYPSTGDRYDDDRSEGRYRDEDRNGYGRERDYRDDDRYSRDGNRYGRESEDQYRDGDYRGRSQNIDDYQYGSRSRSSDGYRERNFDDDRYSSRSSGARAEDQSQDERRLERKFSEQNIGGPPTYEEAVGDVRSPVHNERGRDGEIEEAVAPKASSPTGSMNQGPVSDEVAASGFAANKEVDGFDEFDPRSSASAPPPTTSGEMDLLGSLSDSFSSNALALMPATSNSDADAPFNSGSGPTFVALSSSSTVLSQPIEDPFGDSPFKATPVQEEIPVQAQSNPVTSSFQSMTNSEPLNPSGPRMETGFDFGDTFPGVTYAPSNTQVPSNNLQLLPPEQSFGNQDTDVLANILPPPGPAGPVASQTLFSASSGSQAGNASHGNFGMQASNGGPGNFGVQSGYATQIASQASSTGHGNFGVQSGYTTQASPQASSAGSGNFGMPSGYTTQATPQASSTASGNFGVQSGYTTQVAPQGGAHQAPLTPHQNNDLMGNFLPHTGNTMQMVTQGAITAPTGASSNAHVHKKFEPKSTVWADTLSRGLVNLNISGPKTNPLADIGVDFDSINRKEKREKPAAATPVTSAITMGKAMGSGSGIGRAGANVLARPNTTMNSGMGSGMGMGMGTGGGGGMMGNYGGGMNQNSGMGMRPGMGMGMGMGPGTGMGMGAGMGSGTGMGVGMGMNMGGIGQGRPPVGGLPPGAQMPGNYNPNYNNPMMGGQGNYPQPYGGYR